MEERRRGRDSESNRESGSSPGPGGKLLELRGVRKEFRSGRRGVKVLGGIDLSVGRGEVVALLGLSGAGKTTLLHVIAGLTGADSGSAYFDGSPLRLSETHHGRDRMSLVFQDPYAAVSAHLRVGESILEALKIRNGTRTGERDLASGALRSVGLVPPEAYLDRYPGRLSGGQRQRVAIARALITRPALLLADEPTSMLDASSGVEILNLFRHLVEGGMAILVTMHDLNAAGYVADRILVVSGGVVVEEGSRDSILPGSYREASRTSPRKDNGHCSESERQFSEHREGRSHVVAGASRP